MQKYIDFRKEIDYEKLEEVANLIKKGKIVIFPTETVYGIGTNGLDENAIKRLYEVKKRPLSKPINLLVSDIKMVERISKNISNIEYKLMKNFFPGPFTIILNKGEIVPDILTANGNTVGVRMPDGESARKLVEYAEVPIAAPSANISGKPSGTNLETIKKDFNDKIVDCFIDGGESKLGIASTIVKVIDDVPHILRIGSISEQDIKNVVGKVIVDI